MDSIWIIPGKVKASRMYLAMLAETKTMISAYESENMLKQFALDIHNSQGNIRRKLAAMKPGILAAKCAKRLLNQEFYQRLAYTKYILCTVMNVRIRVNNKNPM